MNRKEFAEVYDLLINYSQPDWVLPIIPFLLNIEIKFKRKPSKSVERFFCDGEKE